MNDAREDIRYTDIWIILKDLHSKIDTLPISKNEPYSYPFEIKKNLMCDSSMIFKLQKITENMCFYLRLYAVPRLLYVEEWYNNNNSKNRVFTCEANGTVHSFEKKRDYAGLYEANQTITIVNKKGYTLKHILGIIAHEVTHHFLRQYNFSKSTERENEIFTDITATYLGFGHILFPAYKIISYTTDWKANEDNSYSYINNESTIGYITPETILRAISITCEMKNWNPKDMIKNFDDANDRSNISRKLFKYRLKLLKKELLLSKANNKLKKHNDKIQKYLLDLNTIQKKYNDIKMMISNTSYFSNKSISKETGEFLVQITNDIFSLSTEEEIKGCIQKCKTCNYVNKELENEILLSKKILEIKINSWLKNIKEVIK